MDLNITKLATLDAGKSNEFLNRVDSKLMMDVSKSQIVENDEWMKQHIQEIKTPIFVRANNVSIYSPAGSKLYDYLQIGFDIELLSKNLL